MRKLKRQCPTCGGRLGYKLIGHVYAGVRVGCVGSTHCDGEWAWNGSYEDAVTLWETQYVPGPACDLEALQREMYPR